MEAGAIVEEGPPAQIFKQPRERRTAEFIDAVLSHL